MAKELARAPIGMDSALKKRIHDEARRICQYDRNPYLERFDTVRPRIIRDGGGYWVSCPCAWIAGENMQDSSSLSELRERVRKGVQRLCQYDSNIYLGYFDKVRPLFILSEGGCWASCHCTWVSGKNVWDGPPPPKNEEYELEDDSHER